MVTRTVVSGCAAALVASGLAQGSALAAAPSADDLVRPITAEQLPGVVYTAHRGGALEVPENSMSGLREAFASGAASVLDFDTRMLRDGTLVVIHDATLDRTTNKSGPVRDLSKAEWKDVRLQPPPSLRGRFKPERPPTLAEVLKAFGGRSVMMLEVKDPGSVGAVAKELKKRKLTSSVFVNTNSPDVARQIKRAGLLSQLWRSASQMKHDKPGRWRSFVDVLDVDHRAKDSDLRRFAASGVSRVWAHTVNTTRQRDRAFRHGCNGIITDSPTLLAAS